MKLTPLDIQQQQFRTVVVGGFDAKEVDAYLDMVSSAMEGLIRENSGLKDQLKQKEALLDDHRQREKALKETMITADQDRRGHQTGRGERRSERHRCGRAAG